MSKSSGAESRQTDLAELKERLESLEHDLQAVKDGLAFHENRLNNLSLSSETVDVISTRTLRGLGQLLVTLTEPQQQQTLSEEEVSEAAVKEA